jgi:two-component system, cell cycle sensor histidine kinase and response regulator CckA
MWDMERPVPGHGREGDQHGRRGPSTARRHPRELPDHLRRGHPDLGPVRADPSQLEQVVLNLLVNARDAMPDGGTLTIETREVELDRGHVAMSATDTVIGMDADTQARIFEPFFTARGAASASRAPTESSALEKLHSRALSTGRGHDVHDPAPARPRPRRATTTPPQATGPARRTETVLIVEDDRSIRDLLRCILESHGQAVLTVANGTAALELSDRHDGPIQLAITDILMPGISGLELARELHTRRLRPQGLHGRHPHPQDRRAA